MESSTYLGASEEHVHYNNHQLVAGTAIKLFEVDGIDENTVWLDMKNCTGTMDEITFSLLPNIQYISMEKCNVQSCPKTFSPILELKTLQINKSCFPLEHNTFQENKGITTFHIQNMESPINACFQYLNKLENLSFEGCTFGTISRDFFTGLTSLKGLSISKCQIEAIDIEAFRDLSKLEGLDVRDIEIAEINPDIFTNLSNLKFLSFHDNKIDSEIDFNILKNVESLETLHLDTSIYKTLNFDNFSSLKNVKIGYIDGEENVADEEVIETLKSKNITTEYVFCGSIDYDSDEMQECC